MTIASNGDLLIYKRQDNSLELYKCVDASDMKKGGVKIMNTTNSKRIFDSTFKGKTAFNKKVRLCRSWLTPGDEGYLGMERVKVDSLESTGTNSILVKLYINSKNKVVSYYMDVVAKEFQFLE